MTALQTSTSVRIAGFAFAVITTMATLGATVGGMQAGSVGAPQIVAMDSVTVSATKLN
jgi:hypothetical protein